MFIFSMPDWMLNVKPNHNGILQNVREIHVLYKGVYVYLVASQTTHLIHPIARDNWVLS